MSFDKVVNIGKVMGKKLEKVGINNINELSKIGAKEAFLRTLEIDSDACICSLYALEGAIRNTRWHNLPKETKDELLKFYKEVK